MNTVTAMLTYLLQCNSDVTSLMSGTAIKAVVAYVSDYITKPGLKTYSIFDIIRSVFDKNSEMIGSDIKRKEKVRKIFTQVVNSLMAKSETGSPMASLYVLGNPDHYTNFIFIPFYWRSYVKEVLNAWKEEDSCEIPDLDRVKDNVVINKNQGQFVGLSKVSDYVYRPNIYENTTLYDWICFYKKSPKRKLRKKHVGDAVDDPEFDGSDDELNIRPKDVSGHVDITANEKSGLVKEDDDDGDDCPLGDYIEDDIYTDEKTDKNEDGDGDDELDVMDEIAECVLKKDYSFRQGHPQLQTHQARMQGENPCVAPNFLPNMLPRSDRGDREYYCCTMLTLFKPWRTGKDLKADVHSWDQSFVGHEFTKRQTEIMKYLNTRYECLGARDDYSAKRSKEGGILHQWGMDNDVLAGLDDMRDFELATSGDYFDPGKEYEGLENDVFLVPGKLGKRRINEMMATERTMKLAGWLDECTDGLPDVGTLVPVKPEYDQPAKAWRSAVLAKK
jgi:hypothetical protein